MTVILCASETWFDYEVLHQGVYNDVCGVKPAWKDYIEGNGLELNTLASGQAVYLHYLEQYGSKREALLKYKGVKNSVKVKRIVDKIIRLETEYKDRIKTLVKEIKKNEQNRGY